MKHRIFSLEVMRVTPIPVDHRDEKMRKRERKAKE
jgi:hypothetical protein